MITSSIPVASGKRCFVLRQRPTSHYISVYGNKSLARPLSFILSTYICWGIIGICCLYHWGSLNAHCLIFNRVVFHLLIHSQVNTNFLLSVSPFCSKDHKNKLYWSWLDWLLVVCFIFSIYIELKLSSSIVW